MKYFCMTRYADFYSIPQDAQEFSKLFMSLLESSLANQVFLFKLTPAISPNVTVKIPYYANLWSSVLLFDQLWRGSNAVLAESNSQAFERLLFPEYISANILQYPIE